MKAMSKTEVQYKGIGRGDRLVGKSRTNARNKKLRENSSEKRKGKGSPEIRETEVANEVVENEKLLMGSIDLCSKKLEVIGYDFNRLSGDSW